MKKLIKMILVVMLLSLISSTALAAGVLDYDANTDPQLTDLFYWIDDPGGTPANNKILWGTLLDDTKGNGDTAFIWSADKIFDQLALKCDESTFGDAIEADDFVKTGTTLTLQAEIPHTDVAETLTQPWDLANSDCDTCTGIPLDSDFTATGNGIMVRTAAGAYETETTFDIDLTAGAVLEGDSGGKAAIKTSIWKHMNVPISNANPDGTNCEAVASISAGSSDFNALASQCDNDAVGNFKFAVPMPENWDGADAVDELKVMIHWGVNVGDPTSTQTVSWDAKFCSASHGEPLGTWVNATIVTHTFVADDAQYDHYVTELSADTAIVGAAGDMLWIAIWRDTGVDTYAEYVQVYGFTIYYKTDDLDAMD